MDLATSSLARAKNIAAAAAVLEQYSMEAAANAFAGALCFVSVARSYLKIAGLWHTAKAFRDEADAFEATFKTPAMIRAIEQRN